MVRLLCLHAITKGCTLESTVCQISVQKVFEALVKEKKNPIHLLHIFACYIEYSLRSILL